MRLNIPRLQLAGSTPGKKIQLTLFEKVGVYHYYSKFGILSRTKGVKGHTLRVDLQPKCTLVLFPLQRDYT